MGSRIRARAERAAPQPRPPWPRSVPQGVFAEYDLRACLRQPHGSVRPYRNLVFTADHDVPIDWGAASPTPATSQ